MSSDQADLRAAKILLDASEEDLMKQLALAYGGDRAFPKDLLAQGQLLYSNFKSYAEETVCQSDQVYNIVRNETGERRAMLVCAIADLLGGMGGVTCAALLVKESVETLCRRRWSERK